MDFNRFNMGGGTVIEQWGIGEGRSVNQITKAKGVEEEQSVCRTWSVQVRDRPKAETEWWFSAVKVREGQKVKKNNKRFLADQKFRGGPKPTKEAKKLMFTRGFHKQSGRRAA